MKKTYLGLEWPSWWDGGVRTELHYTIQSEIFLLQTLT